MEALYTFIKWKRQEWNPRSKKESNKKINYGEWKPDGEMRLRWFLEWLGIESFLAYFFYRSFWAIPVLFPGVWFYEKERVKRARDKRKSSLEQQFKETLLSVQTNLQAGYSLENSFLESRFYMTDLYGSGCDMVRELEGIAKGLSNGDTLEHLLWDLGKRCPCSALKDFADIYSIARKMGNGWGEIIVKIIDSINRQIEIKQEIEILIHGKKVESRIMCIVPFFILFYMNLTSKGYFDVLYHNPAGIIIMTICLAVYIFAFLLSERVTKI